MTQLSRVKRYENLRKEIENEKSVSGVKSELLDSKKVFNATNETYTPVHRKNFNVDPTSTTTDTDSAFKNEYLDSFIEEVRQYNISKGIREHEDTKLDILQQLSSKNRERRANYIRQIDEAVEEAHEVSEVIEETAVNTEDQTLEISRQVFELINGSDETEEVIEEVVEEVVDEVEKTTEEVVVDEIGSSLEEKIAALEKEISEYNLEEKEFISQTASMVKPILEKEEISEITKNELLEHTLELQAKVDSYKEELSEMNNDISNNNRLLNIIIIILVCALAGVIGLVIYWLISGGII